MPAPLQALVNRDAQLAVNQGVELINVGAPLARPSQVEMFSLWYSVSCLFRCDGPVRRVEHHFIFAPLA